MLSLPLFVIPAPAFAGTSSAGIQKYEEKIYNGLIYIKVHADSPGFLYLLPASTGTSFAGMTLCKKGINFYN